MSTAPAIEQIDVEHLDPAPDNPRSSLGDLEGLAASIREVGILQPILVASNGKPDRYTIVAGHRRVEAAKLAGLTTVDAIVEEGGDETEIRLVRLVENLQREDLAALDRARGFKQLVDLKLTQKEIGDRVGVSQATVSKHLSMLKLPKKAQERIVSGEITQEDAATLAGLPKDLQEEVIEGDLSIQWAKQDAGAREEVQAAITELKKAGVKFVEWKTVKWTHGSGGPVALSVMHWVKKKAHESAECRAVSIDPNAPQKLPLEVCTTPKNHARPKSTAPAGRKETDKERDRREERERLNALLVEENVRRVEWVKSVKGTASGLLRACLRMLLADGERGEVDVGRLGDALGVKNSIDAVLEAVTDESTAKRALFLALALDTEALMEPDSYGDFELYAYGAEAAQQYLEALESLGYQLSWIERRYVGLPHDEPKAVDEDADLPAITITKKKGKFHISCAECGHVGFNTSEDVAQQRGELHRKEHRK